MRTSTAAGLLVAGLTGGTIGACNLLIPSYDRYGATGGSASSASSSSTGGGGGSGGSTVDAGPTRGIWAVSSAGASVKAVAVDGSGNIYLTGRTDGTVPFGCAAPDGGSGTGYLAELDSGGHCQWLLLFGTDAEGTGVAVDSGGNIGLSGNYTGTVTLDPSWLGFPAPTGMGQTNSFLALLSNDHSFRWASTFADDYGQSPGDHKSTAASFGDGRLGVSVTFNGSARFFSSVASATMKISDPSDGEDAFAIWFDTGTGAVGNWVYARSTGTGTDQAMAGVAIDPSGNVAVVGTTTGAASFTGVMSGTSSPGSAFVAASDSQGHGQGATVISDQLKQEGRAVVYDVMSDILVGTTFYGSAYPSGSPDGGAYVTGGRSVLIARYNPAAQSFLGATQLGSDDTSANATLGGMATYAAAGVIFAGGFQGTAHLPEGESITTAPNSTAVYVAKVNLALDAGVWVEGYGDGTSHQVADAVAVDSNSGEIVVVGHFQGTLDFGGKSHPMSNTSNTDKLFVAKLKP